jgi:hypothetical protein
VEECLHEKKSIAGPSSMGDTWGSGSKYLRKLTGKKEKDCSVYRKRTEHGEGKRR